MNQYEHQNISKEELDLLFSSTGTKYNTLVKLTEEDKKNRIKILCTESYAQEVYDRMKKQETSSGQRYTNKDLVTGESYKVIALSLIHI